MFFKKDNKSTIAENFEKALSEEDDFSLSMDPECISDLVRNRRPENPISVKDEPSEASQDISRMMRIPASILEVTKGTKGSLASEQTKDAEHTFLELRFSSVCITGLCPVPEDKARVYFTKLEDLEQAEKQLIEAKSKDLCVMLTPAVIWPSLNGIYLEDCEVEITKVTMDKYLASFERY